MDDSGVVTLLDQWSWDAASGALVFRRVDGGGGAEWFQVQLASGLMVGRFSPDDGASTDAPLDVGAYRGHVTGWSGSEFDQDLVPRCWDLALDDGRLARLRLDRDGGGFIGQFKVYAGTEELEHEITVTQWDGRQLAFHYLDGDQLQSWSGTVDGRLLSGQCGDGCNFTGARAEVLSHGLANMAVDARAAWQGRTRQALLSLVAAGDPAPLSQQATRLSSGVAPRALTQPSVDRDDDPDSFSPQYRLSEWQFDYTLPNPHGGAAIARRSHAWLAEPDAPPPAGFPVALVLNGHGASAWQTTDPNGFYWFGESYARHGFLMLAVDISHRPLADRDGLYPDYEQGDTPADGNVSHPAIAAAGFDSDWEEDGERAWDVMRALDWILARTDVDASRVTVTGLSMGGEVATYVGAFDPRVAVTIPAGFSPDLSVLYHRHNHACWRWLHADIREYVDTADLHALIAPRALLVETGKMDPNFSALPALFVGDKQVMRRSRSAWAEAPEKIVHYLHYDAHRYHVGGVNPWSETEPSVRVPVVVAPANTDSIDWQSDPTTTVGASDLYRWLETIAP
jgi:hypothetical protein